MIFLLRCGDAEGKKLHSIELLNVEADNAHNIILVFDGKQPQETDCSGSSEASNNVSEP